MGFGKSELLRDSRTFLVYYGAHVHFPAYYGAHVHFPAYVHLFTRGGISEVDAVPSSWGEIRAGEKARLGLRV